MAQIAQIVWDPTSEQQQRGTRLLTLENCVQVFEYLPEYQILICKEHGGAVYSWKRHIRKEHAGTAKELKAVIEKFSALKLLHPSKVLLPPKFIAPFKALGEPLDAFLCDGDNNEECDYISIHRNGIAQHCNKVHHWRYAKDDPVHWVSVKVQTFFQGGGFRRYFVVRVPEERQRPQYGTALNHEQQHDAATIKRQWRLAREEHNKELEIADKEIAKQDYTGWFKRTGWPEHLAGRNLKRLAHVSRMPDRDECKLKLATKTVELAIEKCVAGLSTLAHETRRWLKSAQQHEIDVRPMGRLQNPESQGKYARYMQRFICYCLRVAAVCREADNQGWSEDEGSSDESNEESSGEDGESSNESSSDESSSDENSSDEKKLWKEVRGLCIWHGNQKEMLDEMWQSLQHDDDEAELIKKMIRLLGLFILHTVGDRPFSSPLIHFLAVLGINEDTGRLRRAEDYSYMLAGVVYCARVVGVEVLLPSHKRDEQGTAERENFLEKRREFLADGSYSVISTMLSLLAYGKHIALNTGNEGLVHWSPDRKWLTLRGRRLVIERWKGMIQDAVDEAERLLWEEVMWMGREDRFTIPLDEIVDDVTFTRRGISFVSKSSNGLAGGLDWMINRMLVSSEGCKMRKGSEWNVRLVRRYLRKMDEFLEMLLFCTHTTAGQPARGTEITTARFQNGFLQDRNVYVIDGRVVFITRYHKSQSQWDKPKVIPRFLPWRVGQLMVVYLGYAQPFREHLTVEISDSGWTEYVWGGLNGPWETDKLTSIITRQSTKGLGERLTTLDYRHAAISIGRVFISEQFAAGYKEEVGEIEEPEMEGEDGLEISAGRTEKIGVQRYGVPSDIIKHLSIRSMETFRPLSEAWHQFLGLSSDEHKERKRLQRLADAGKKRKRLIECGVDNMVVSGGSAIELTARKVKRLNDGTHADGAGGGQQRQVGVDSAEFQAAMQKALGRANVSFRSKEQQQGMEAVLAGQTPLVVVLPTGGGKSLLFMAPACLDDPGVTILVAPFRALVDNMVDRLQKMGIDCLEWKFGEVNAAAVVVVSADVAGDWRFLDYGSLLVRQKLLRRIVIDECHLTFTSSDYRPKLAHLKRLRSLNCPMVLLTATLPRVLEVELSESMLVPLARYIRAVTVRKNTRYSVHWCPRGEDVAVMAVDMVRRQEERLRGQKGVVYCRTREHCEALAEELGCGYYHAASMEKEKQLEEWVEVGGIIVATSALGTGVDYPGIVFVLHVGLPYGMIDFAQESGRAGREGEAVDSVILVTEDEMDRMMVRKERTVDEEAMVCFVEASGCRRAVMSRYLDGEEIECLDMDMAGCDRCCEGTQDWVRSQVDAERDWGVVRSVLDELVDGCAGCWVTQEGEDVHMHSMQRCQVQQELTQRACDEFRQLIRYEVRSHSCMKCGISQKFCVTGIEGGRRCQWPNVVVPVVRAAMGSDGGFEMIKRLGYKGGFQDWGEYGAWLGRRYKRRYWGEWMSNAMVVMIEIILFIMGQ